MLGLRLAPEKQPSLCPRSVFAHESIRIFSREDRVNVENFLIFIGREQYPPIPDPEPVVTLEFPGQRPDVRVKERDLLLLELAQGPFDSLPYSLVELEILLLSRGLDLNQPDLQAISP